MDSKTETKTETKTTPLSLPVAPVAIGIQVEVRNPREWKPDNSREVYYMADAEVATPGKRWATLRVKVKSDRPVPTGMQTIVLDTFDFKKGIGEAHVEQA